jgi:hypothetical protein
MRRSLVIYDFALHPIPLNFLTYGEIFIFFFISVHLHCPVSGLPGFIIALALLDRATGKLRFKENILFSELGVFIFESNKLTFLLLYSTLLHLPPLMMHSVKGQSLSWLANV